MPSTDTLRILLLQFRPDPLVCEHEVEGFAAHAGMRLDQIRAVNALEADLDFSLLDGVDALMLGGSGDYLLTQGHIPEVAEKVKTLIREARRRGLPTLGVCFGAQFVTLALGGELKHDLERQETGTFLVSKTPAAAACPIFSQLPDRFDAQLGHKDHLEVMPAGAVHLVSSERSPIQAYTFPGEPLYAMIIHPEMDEDGMMFRIDYYGKNYGIPKETQDAFRAALRPSPDASRILRLFLEKVVAGGERYPVILESVL
ncbi:gamma-glutamyl-gamma-aminobutyrate hydrolase family protein [Candidatus Uhrbacteria bacterium]|nr:gamma-glutamyl-gamma-aminobutyrate hydrolase family protein [Candidatus Uhrbacteria bacterium]